MKCKHCGSSYTNFVREKGTPEQRIRIYHCDGCNQDFECVKKIDTSNEEWVITFYGITNYSDDPQDFAKVMKKADGTVVCHQKKYADYKTSFNTYENVPDLSIKYQDGMFSGYHLWFSTYRWGNDPNGNLFIVKRVEYGPALAEQAKSVEALRILQRKDYLKTSLKSDAVLRDAVRYIEAAIGNGPAGSESADSSGGCYVATCVYGSYDCPQVWTLRRYRDQVLAENWLGRLFVKCYYAVSPTLVKWFGETKWFKSLWKGSLDKMVTKLQEKGMESTPYKDRKW